MKKFFLSKGHNLLIEGVPDKEIFILDDSKSILFHPSRIKNFKTKLLVSKGDSVKIGSPLFFDKKNDKILHVSSCSGIVKDIVFGPRRIVERIEIDNNFKNDCLEFDLKITKDNLMQSGLWTYLRQKPFSKIPNFDSMPKSIFISAMPTEPFAIDNSFLFDQYQHLQNGIDCLKSIFECDINISVSDNTFSFLKNVSFFQFNKLHPAGNVGIQMHHIDPIKNANDQRWYLSIQDLDRIGSFFSSGKYPNYRYCSIGGNGFEKPGIYKKIIGTPISSLKQLVIDSNTRIISGDVLNGKEVSADSSIDYHDEVLSLIKTSHDKEFLGWLRPGLKKYSLGSTFLSKLVNNTSSILTTKKNGSVRSIIPMGAWDNVLPMDILPEFLIKNVLAKDIEMMEKLGIYECSPEDFALCSFVCQSKVEVSKIIQDGLDLMEAEG